MALLGIQSATAEQSSISAVHTEAECAEESQLTLFSGEGTSSRAAVAIAVTGLAAILCCTLAPLFNPCTVPVNGLPGRTPTLCDNIMTLKLCYLARISLSSRFSLCTVARSPACLLRMRFIFCPLFRQAVRRAFHL